MKKTFAFLLLVGSICFIGNHYYKQNLKDFNNDSDDVDEVTGMFLKTMVFKDVKSTIALIKPKKNECVFFSDLFKKDALSAHVQIRPNKFVPYYDNNSYVKVIIDGEEYNISKFRREKAGKNYSKNLPKEDLATGRVTFKIDLPAYDEFNKKELPIRCEYYWKDQLIDAIEDKITYLDEGEEFTYVQNKTATMAGWCQKPSYFKDQILHPVNKPGVYRLEKKIIRTITKENDRYKIVSSSPPGFLVLEQDESYQVPVPSFPDKVTYVDLSYNLEPGTYVKQYADDKSYGRVVEKEDIGKYISYYYDGADINTEKTISYEDCELVVHQTNCQRIPVGVYVTLEDYPVEINNTYL